jgi:hypothetical protein
MSRVYGCAELNGHIGKPKTVSVWAIFVNGLRRLMDETN